MDKEFKTSHEINLHGQHFRLLRERAVFWQEKKFLLIADPHFGKAATFRSHGIAIPSGTTKDDLNRLSDLIDATKPRKLIIIGDLVHDAAGKTRSTLDAVEEWRRKFSKLSIVLVQGNHDRRSEPLPEEFRLNEITMQFKEDFIVCTHRPEPVRGNYVLSGHIHPAVRIRGVGRQKEYLPCFYFGKDYAVLPAFGSFTGQAAIYPESGDRIFVLGGEEIAEWKGVHAR